MAQQTCMGASMMCSFGAAPSSLMVLPANRVLTGTPDANIIDNATNGKHSSLRSL